MLTRIVSRFVYTRLDESRLQREDKETFCCINTGRVWNAFDCYCFMLFRIQNRYAIAGDVVRKLEGKEGWGEGAVTRRIMRGLWLYYTYKRYYYITSNTNAMILMMKEIIMIEWNVINEKCDIRKRKKRNGRSNLIKWKLFRIELSIKKD